MQDIQNTKIFPLVSTVSNLPSAGDAELLNLGLEEWTRLTSENPDLTAFASAFSADPKCGDILTAIFGNSPYLSHCLLSDIGFFHHLICHGADKSLELIYDTLGEMTGPETDKAGTMSALRLAKRRIALLTAVCDMGNCWPLMKITDALSDFADTAVEICCKHLLWEAGRKGELTLADPEDPTKDSGLVILGMGKLGAGELNYSSDIDLIVLFDDAKVIYTGRRSVQDCFVKITRNLVQMMQERTVDGYVFRTDLRLRPDPGATPIALSVGAAHVYYESQGQNWERAAMIKARPIAGDLEAGAELIRFLIPFVWRKSMDFAAIEDIQAIKSQIHAHKGFSEISLEGHNIKIGRGGIREVEFFCQTQQLIEGGRNPHLRTPTTLQTLEELEIARKIGHDVHAELHDAYIFLRTLEHRLQMVNDEQTQLLPDRPEDFAKLGIFLGYDNAEEFRNILFSTLSCVQRHYDGLFEFETTPDRVVGRLVFTGTDNDPDTITSLTEIGFQNAESLSQKIREWHHGRYRATRTVRAKQILTELTPQLLEALANTTDPDKAFTRFDAFLQKLPAGVQLFSLFKAHPSLLKLVAQIMGMAPELAGNLAQNPELLDNVLSRNFMDHHPHIEELEADLDLMLSTARDFQDVLDISRRWANDAKFRIGVQILKNVDHGTDNGAMAVAGPALTDIAEVILLRLYPAVFAELAEKHGVVPGGQFAVVAAGKMGSRQMRPRSDIDLVFVYDTPEDDMVTNGPKPIPAGLFYTRLSQRYINALSALTGEGSLYEVDMRLRPHGKSGPIALNLQGFETYYSKEAWTWEHLALTRARTVSGDPDLMSKVTTALFKINSTRREPEMMRRDVAHMRARVHKEHKTNSIWSGKHVIGGLMDLEFLCQYFRLVYGHENPSILRPNTIACLEELSKCQILPDGQAKRLIEIDSLYLNISGLLQICLGDRVMDDTAPTALRNALADAGQVENFEALAEKLKNSQIYVDETFVQYVGNDP
ncbi:MAG: bifunctional [glutamate--ammonia ligase]-adenylyl-L-tyrosine phosphorylase/[glutamate--ammonia-ligase] adenylyltransferase [Sneathiella sp.]|nr:MAG: bifunctional [glutamate--ammonia ligase]-adenylyl-L-tyrosine phosphorylase/[glutamate--ammonia-ligase] adenylyltransferase [Sneathiella sp.]